MDVGPQNVRSAAGHPDAVRDGADPVSRVREADPEVGDVRGPAALPDAALGEAVPGKLAAERPRHWRVITFTAHGTPAPKGSARAFVNKRTGRAILAPGGSKATEERIASWNVAVREAALRAIGEQREAPPFVGVALHVTIVFHVKRPAGHYGTGKHAGRLKPAAPARPTGKPDIDKLARTTLDALTGAVFDDDSRIAELVLSKRWALPGHEGAQITVAEAL